jgi:hypothetical protein
VCCFCCALAVCLSQPRVMLSPTPRRLSQLQPQVLSHRGGRVSNSRLSLVATGSPTLAFIGFINGSRTTRNCPFGWISRSKCTRFALTLRLCPPALPSRGSEWAVDINAQATNCKAIVIVWTPEWEASGHCTAEYRVAKKHGAAVFVVLPNEKAEIPAAGSVVFDEVP